MDIDIALTFGILVIAIILFISEVVRVDLVALGVLVAITLAQLVHPEEAISGFSNPAVITIWSMFILSAGLSRTGIANMIGKRVMRLAGNNDGRVVAVLMSVTGLLSAIMNNIGVASMFLPITMEIARRTGKPASKLLIPMAYGSLLGGMILLISTATNLLVRDALREAGFKPFGLFDFATGGLIIMAICIAYMTFIGRRFLPERESLRPSLFNVRNDRNVYSFYGLEERLATLVLPKDSLLAGKSIGESRIGLLLGLNVLNIKRISGERINADAGTILLGGDRLLILGRLDQIEELSRNPIFNIEEDESALSRLISDDIGLAEFMVREKSNFHNNTLANLRVRQNFGVNVFAILHNGVARRTNLQHIALQSGDRLLIQGHLSNLEKFNDQAGFRILGLKEAENYHLEERLLLIRIPKGSMLAGRTLSESRLGAVFGLMVLGINQGDDQWMISKPDITLQEADRLIIEGHPRDMDVLKGLSTLEIDQNIDVNLEDLECGQMQIIDIMLSPFTSLNGKTLRELHFREKYNLSVLAIWRGERAYRTNLGDIPLNYGDALLCYGLLDRFKLLASDRDFVVLKTDVQEKPHQEKAPLSATIMMGVIGSVIIFGAPISIAALAGVVLMVLTRCLTMDEAYQSIDWRSVFLIAAMLPMGLAMQQTGAAHYLADIVVNLTGVYGPTAILAGLMVLVMAATLVMPSPVVAVIMSPIALSTAVNMGISPYAFMMGIAYALAAAFLSPVSHPANVLVMSPGGYRSMDYVKQGLPLLLLVLLVSLPLLPLLFPY